MQQIEINGVIYETGKSSEVIIDKNNSKELLEKITIAVDSGHDTPHDLGKELKNLQIAEFYENKKIAILVQEWLYRKGYIVEDFSGHLIKEKIPFINTINANACVEIHHNANNNIKIRGAEVIYHPKSVFSKELAECIISYIDSAGFETHGVFEGWWRYNPKSKKYFAFTSKIWKPSVIVECAYLTNPYDLKVIKTNTYSSRMAEAIAKSIDNYVR